MATEKLRYVWTNSATSTVIFCFTDLSIIINGKTFRQRKLQTSFFNSATLHVTFAVRRKFHVDDVMSEKRYGCFVG